MAAGSSKVSAVDAHLGRRLKVRRRQLGISQQALAERLGVSFQQVQKYEKGANRLSAAMLYEASRALSLPVSSFFDGLGEAGTGATQAELAASPEGAELANAYLAIRRPALRSGLLSIARELVRMEVASRQA